MAVILQLKTQASLTEGTKGYTYSPRRRIHSFGQKVLWEALALRSRNRSEVWVSLKVTDFSWIVILNMIILFELRGT